MPVVGADLRVTGRVQGVFYRDACRREAARLGVVGWVRNEDDVAVAGHFEGEQDAVEALVAWCRQGPPQARVDGVTTTPSVVTGADRFQVRD